MAGRVRRKLGLVEADERAAREDEPPACALCERPLGAKVEWHHLIPKSEGGRVTAPVHPICHRTIHALVSNRELATAFADVDALRAHQGRPSWRPEVVRKAVERGEAQRREIPAALLEALAPWEDVRAWAAGAHSIVAHGYSATELARALERSEPTVRQRLRRHPPA